MKKIINNLNKKFKKMYPEGIQDIIPVTYLNDSKGRNGVTIIPDKLPKDVSGFELKPSFAGGIVKVKAGKKINNSAAIHLTLIGYVSAKRMSGNLRIFNTTMVHIINQALKELTEELGDLTFRNYGVDNKGEVFKTLENRAAIEFKIYVGRDL